MASVRPEITGRRIAFSVNEVAAATGICRSKLYAAIASGALEAVKDGKRTLITAEAEQKYIAGLPRLVLNRPERAPNQDRQVVDRDPGRRKKKPP